MVNEMNFREVNKKLNELKNNVKVWEGNFMFSEPQRDGEIIASMEMFEARKDLARFRSTKISQYDAYLCHC